jgi:hypothetical protein
LVSAGIVDSSASGQPLVIRPCAGDVAASLTLYNMSHWQAAIDWREGDRQDTLIGKASMHGITGYL